MAILVEVTVPTAADGPDSTPTRIFNEVPDIEIEVESCVPMGNAAIPYFWAWGERIDRVERALEADPKVHNVNCIERVDDGALFSVEWDVDAPFVECLNQANGTIMDAYGTASEWRLTLCFETDDDAAAFQHCCKARKISFEIIRLRPIADMTIGSDPDITPAQREAMLLAYERGFFEQPRNVTQADLAEELGVSSAAFGNRIRRGMANLIESTMLVGTSADFLHSGGDQSNVHTDKPI